MQTNPAHRGSQQHHSQNSGEAQRRKEPNTRQQVKGEAQRRKEPRYTLAGEGTIQVWQSRTTDRHAAMERGVVMTRATMRRNHHAR